MTAGLVSPSRVIAVAANTRRLSAAAAQQECEQTEQLLGVPCCDVYRDGAGKLVEAVLRLRREIEEEYLTAEQHG
jgi:uncharacterized NAD-dependent epimerase/dehydratase family protein